MVGRAMVTCFLTLMLFSQYGWSTSSLEKRRITAGDNHITSQELYDFCCKTSGARKCCPTKEGKAKKLKDDMNTCKIAVKASKPENYCGSFEDRSYARKVHYCGVLLSINEKVEYDLKPRLNEHLACVREDIKDDPAGYDPDSYSLPSRILYSLDVWHEEFIRRHKDQDKCCKGTRVSKLESVTTEPPLVTVTAEPSPNCKSKFFEAADEVIALFEYVYFIERLGRNKDKADKKPCPRGCGTRLEYFNCGLPVLKYLNITLPPPPPPSTPTTAPPATPPATISATLVTVVSPTEANSNSTDSRVGYIPVSS